MGEFDFKDIVEKTAKEMAKSMKKATEGVTDWASSKEMSETIAAVGREMAKLSKEGKISFVIDGSETKGSWYEDGTHEYDSWDSADGRTHYDEAAEAAARDLEKKLEAIAFVKKEESERVCSLIDHYQRDINEFTKEFCKDYKDTGGESGDVKKLLKHLTNLKVSVDKDIDKLIKLADAAKKDVTYEWKTLGGVTFTHKNAHKNKDINVIEIFHVYLQRTSHGRGTMLRVTTENIQLTGGGDSKSYEYIGKDKGLTVAFVNKIDSLIDKYKDEYSVTDVWIDGLSSPLKKAITTELWVAVGDGRTITATLSEKYVDEMAEVMLGMDIKRVQKVLKRVKSMGTLVQIERVIDRTEFETDDTWYKQFTFCMEKARAELRLDAKRSFV